MSKALRRFIKSPASMAEANQLAREINTSSPRGGAMVAASFLDNFVMKLIIVHLEPLSASEVDGLFGPERPLGSFSSKIKLGRAMGLFGPKTAHDLNLMREIRNAFAHGLRKMNFETPEVRQLVGSLHVINDIANHKKLRPRKLFFEAVAMISTHLHDKGINSVKAPRAPPNLGCFCPHLD
jgi:DNA-binding MltR family transcriptional regulator